MLCHVTYAGTTVARGRGLAARRALTGRAGRPRERSRRMRATARWIVRGFNSRSRDLAASRRRARLRHRRQRALRHLSARQRRRGVHPPRAPSGSSGNSRRRSRARSSMRIEHPRARDPWSALVTSVHVNGVDLEYVDEGTGVPVVFSHGGSSDLRYWEPQREIFAAELPVRRLQPPVPRSRSWPATGDYSADAHANDLVAIMRRLDTGPVHLVGFSTAIALRATLRAPGLVRSLTIIEPNVPWLLEGDPEGEAVLAWWRDRERTRAGRGTRRPRARSQAVVRARQQPGTGYVRRPARGSPPDVARQLQREATRGPAARATDVRAARRHHDADARRRRRARACPIRDGSSTLSPRASPTVAWSSCLR